MCVFVPHSFNFGSLERVVLPLAQVASIALLSGDVNVAARGGSAWRYRVRKGAELRDAIERARTGR